MGCSNSKLDNTAPIAQEHNLPARLSTRSATQASSQRGPPETSGGRRTISGSTSRGGSQPSLYGPRVRSLTSGAGPSSTHGRQRHQKHGEQLSALEEQTPPQPYAYSLFTSTSADHPSTPSYRVSSSSPFINSMSGAQLTRQRTPRTAKDTFSEAKMKWKSCLGDRYAEVLSNYSSPEDQNGLYRPLPSERHTRLLKVSCNFSGPSKRFFGELIPVSLDRPEIPYLAISYTWGDRRVAAKIICGKDEGIEITQSVYTILDTLLDENEMLCLWIDAICINQEDLREKAQQVRVIGDIFKNAAHVIVSLGESSPDTDLGMDMIYPMKLVLETFGTARANGVQISLESIMPRAFLENWVDFGKILRHPWFGRIWVIQEIAVGQPPLLVCGNRAVDWDTLYFVVSNILENDLQHYVRRDATDNYNPPDDFPDGLTNVTTMHDARYLQQARYVQQEREYVPFQEVLLRMYHFNATDPRDKIFALLGLADNTDDEPLRPDYEATAEQVYYRTALHLLLRDRFIHILHKAGVGYPRKLTRIPSWVPDWTSEGFLEFNSKIRLAASYRAARNSLPRVRRASSEDSIAIDGLRVDVIDQMTIPRPSAPLGGDAAALDSYSTENYRWLSEVEAIVDCLKNSPMEQLDEIVRRSRGFEDWDEALWRTLLANSIFSGFETAPPEYGQYFKAWRQVIINMHLKIYESVENFKGGVAYNTACTNATEKRRFFCTKSGFIGLTAPGTVVGDIVVIFLGGEAPFIIRENAFSDTYTLVGEAYIHDIMNGEAMRADGTETFVLT